MTKKVQRVLFSSTIVDELDVHRLNYARRNNPSLENEADLYGEPLPAVTYGGVQLNSCRIVFSRKAKRVTLARYLCGLIAFQPERVKREHLLVMYDNFLHIQDLAEKNENFREKFGSDLESLAKILKGFRVSSKSSRLDVRKLGQQIKEELTKFTLPERNLSTIENRIKHYYSIQPMRQSGTELRKLPPKAYIGKGYTDKGSARNPAEDGSPSWQDVAVKHVAGERYDE